MRPTRSIIKKPNFNRLPVPFQADRSQVRPLPRYDLHPEVCYCCAIDGSSLRSWNNVSAYHWENRDIKVINETGEDFLLARFVYINFGCASSFSPFSLAC